MTRAAVLPPPAETAAPEQPVVVPPLTREEIAERWDAIAAVEQLDAEILADSGGVALPDSTVNIRASRRSYAEQLLPR